MTEEKRELAENFLLKEALQSQKKSKPSKIPLQKPALREQIHFLSCRLEKGRVLDQKTLPPASPQTLKNNLSDVEKALLAKSQYIQGVEPDFPTLAFATHEEEKALAKLLQQAAQNLLAKKGARPKSCPQGAAELYGEAARTLLQLPPDSLLPTLHIAKRRRLLFLLLSLAALLLSLTAHARLKKERPPSRSLAHLSGMDLATLFSKKQIFVTAPRWNAESIQSLLKLAQIARDNAGSSLLLELGHAQVSRSKMWWSPFSSHDFATGKAVKQLLLNKALFDLKAERKDFFTELEPNIFFLRGSRSEQDSSEFDPIPFSPFHFSLLLVLLPASFRSKESWQKKEFPVLWIEKGERVQIA